MKSEILQNEEKMIINELRKNARASFIDISKKISMPPSTIYEWVKGYEKGIIKKHVSILDFPKVGYFSRMLAAIKVSRESRQEMQKFLEAHPNINSLYRVNSGFDFMAEIIAKNAKELNDIIEEISLKPGFIEKSSFDLIDEIKKEEMKV